jgi:glucosamine-6-phosphate deaminase
MFAAIEGAMQARGTAVLILPVGPVDQYRPLAGLINERGLSLKRTVLINMDEYLTDEDEWIPLDHPLSFRGFMNRNFYDLLDPDLAPPVEQRIFPDPHEPQAIKGLIDAHGGVDACFGGIGINGHIAFNEPPEPGETCEVDHFRRLPTRVLPLARETRTINANTVGGGIEIIPRRCVTVGMREILASRSLRFYCNRPWQSAVIRRVLHGPVTSACPASLLRLHSDAAITVVPFVAQPPDLRLR